MASSSASLEGFDTTKEIDQLNLPSFTRTLLVADPVGGAGWKPHRLSAFAGTPRSAGCCGNSPTSPRPITAKVRSAAAAFFFLHPRLTKHERIGNR